MSSVALSADGAKEGALTESDVSIFLETLYSFAKALRNVSK